jgi:hypothetical protein
MISFEECLPRAPGVVRVRAVPSPQGLSVYFLDITERRLAQQEVERAAARLELLSTSVASSPPRWRRRRRWPGSPKLVVPALADWCLGDLSWPTTVRARRGLLARTTPARGTW